MTAHLLAGAALPAFTWSRLGLTEIDFASVLIGGAGVLYATGVWRYARLHGRGRWPAGRSAAFAGGLAVTFVAVEGAVGVYDDVLFWDHVLQHLLLVMVAAYLFALGAPLVLVEEATGGRLHHLVQRCLRSTPAQLIGHPLFALGLYAFAVPFSHLTSFYTLTLTDRPVHDLEHLALLVVGYLFWRPVAAVEPSRHPLSVPSRLAYLAAALPVGTVTGLVLAFAPHELFPAYRSVHRTWGPSRLADLHTGGDLMWAAGDFMMVAMMIPMALRRTRHRAGDGHLDGRLAPAPVAAGSQPSPT